MNWLIDELRLIKPFNENLKKDLYDKLPQYCTNGVFFADLINRISGRNLLIKGI